MAVTPSDTGLNTEHLEIFKKIEMIIDETLLLYSPPGHHTREIIIEVDDLILNKVGKGNTKSPEADHWRNIIELRLIPAVLQKFEAADWDTEYDEGERSGPKTVRLTPKK